MNYIIGFFMVSGILFYFILLKILFTDWEKDNKELLTESDWWFNK